MYAALVGGEREKRAAYRWLRREWREISPLRRTPKDTNDIIRSVRAGSRDTLSIWTKDSPRARHCYPQNTKYYIFNTHNAIIILPNEFPSSDCHVYV